MSLEKRELDIRFIPILCSAPLVYAAMRGIFEKHGLSVRLKTCPGWSGVKELLVHQKIDAAHVLAPMTLATSLGLDGKPEQLRLCAIQNVNGQALVVGAQHRDIHDVRDMRGFRFGVPYMFSMHYYLLCDFLAKQGIDPLADVVIEEVSPPRMPHYVRMGRIDAVLSPEPFAELLIGEGAGVAIARSSDLWPGHPCCGFAVTKGFTEENPNTSEVLIRCLAEAQFSLRETPDAERAEVAREIGLLAGWDPSTVEAAMRVLCNRGGTTGQRRIDFVPHPFREYGIWMLAQMQRWGQLRREVDAEATVDSIFMSRDVARVVADIDVPDVHPNLEGAGFDALAVMRGAPFGIFSEKSAIADDYEMPVRTRKRIDEILDWLAGLVGAEQTEPLVVTSNDEIGWLERMLAETALNVRFSREALAERVSTLEHAQEREALIAAQGALIQELSAPIMPLFDRVLALPLVGALDDRRAADITTALLARVVQSGAEVVLIDVTGMPSMDGYALDQWLRMTRAVSLLGAECVIVGIRPNVARNIVTQEMHGSMPRTCADLQGGIEYALQRTGRKLTVCRSVTR